MKLTLEKEEIQLLGQLVIEIEQGLYNPTLLVSAVLIWEFKVENSAVFQYPETIKRKVKLSMLIALRSFLALQFPRGDHYWDMTLIGLQDKLERIAKSPVSIQKNHLLLDER